MTFVEGFAQPGPNGRPQRQQQQPDHPAEKANAEMRPVMLLVHMVLLLVHGSVVASILPAAAHAAMRLTWSPVMYTVAVSLPVASLAAYLAFCNVTQRLTVAQRTDLNCLVVCMMPYANLAWHASIPSFDIAQRDWLVFLSFITGMGVSMLELTGGHQVIMWPVMTMPVL